MATADRDGACGWAVDLRPSTGGDMGPLFAVVARVLGDGDVGAFVAADGERGVLTVKDGRLRHGPAFPPAPSVSRKNPPVAVLIDDNTASAGEILALAFHGRPQTRFFGTPSAGRTTGNVSHRLSDGAALVLTETRDADRTGKVYDGPIAPDEEFLADRRDVGTDRGRALGAATAWLGEQPGCR
ncbi:S41 family peptidase [Streptomyces sp. XD-27]|uniref:S41 family peptidase n=1 Tax=Streptomyces sp. XD-27 TaxID=3062779 RepID=UPI0026F41C60|nr:S41 family peptidase [Streptomyces sp. XD-27]WKX71868.1 S41 family peptidase [Streptomyces sp. XD-27]